MVKLLWTTAWSFLRKVNIELPYYPAIPLPGIYSQEVERKDFNKYIFS